MMVLNLLCSLLCYFLSTKSATIDLFLWWCRSLGCRYYFFTNSLEALKVSFQLLKYWLLEEMVWCLYWKFTGWGNIEILWRSSFFFRAKGGRHGHCPNKYCIVGRGLTLVNAVWNELIREKALRSIHSVGNMWMQMSKKKSSFCHMMDGKDV